MSTNADAVVSSETLTTDIVDSSRVSGNDEKVKGDSVVRDGARVCVDEIGSVMNGSDDVVLAEVLGVKVGDDSLGLESGTLTMKASVDHIVVKDSVDDYRAYKDEKGIVMNNSELVLDKLISDAGVSAEALSNRDVDAVDGVKIGDDLFGSETETMTLKPPADHKGDGDIVVQGSVDDTKVSVDETGIVMNNNELVLDKSTSDAVVSSEPLINRDVDTVDGVKTGADSIGSETETLTMKPSDDHDGDGDTVVQDSVDDSRASRDDKGVVTESVEKVSDENEVNNEEKEGEYKVTDIVWAKVKNYPWWPGQIFDASSATDKAKKFSNKKGLLVGYFGDQSFAWNKPPNIKPFRKNFCKLEKQSNSKPFLHAVGCALDEISRRVEFGLACSCLSKEVYDKVKSQVFVNAGIRDEDSKIDGGDRFSTVSTFKPANVVQSVQDLAREHFDGFNRLEVLSIRSQLLAFFRWKGYYKFQAQDILDEPDNKLGAESELPLTEENKEVEDEKLASLGKKVSSKKRKPDVCDSDDSVPRKKERSSINVTPKGNSSAKRSKKGISKKATAEDDVIEKNGNEKPHSAGKKVSSKKTKPDDCDSDDSVPRKKETSFKKMTSKGSSSVKRSKNNISKKATVEDDVIEENGNEKPDFAGKKVSSKKRKLDDCDSDDSAPRTKEKSLTKMTPKGSSSVKRSKNNTSNKTALKDEENGNGTDNKKSSISSPKIFRIGDSICKIAKQISESPSILKKEKESEKSKNDENSATLKKTAKKDGQPVEADETEE